MSLETHATSQTNTPEPPQDEDEINLLDLLIVLAKHKKKIIFVPILVALLTAGISSMLPNIYTASTKFMTPQGSQGSGSAMLSQLGALGGLGGLAGGALGIKNPADVYIALLKSRPVEELVIQKFGLQKERDDQFVSDTRKYLAEVVKISSGKDGTMTIEVDDESPARAAEMANFYFAELKRIISSNAVTEAAQRRKFFENELKPARDKLTEAQLVLDRTPTSSLKYLDGMREMKYREALWEVLVKQYEGARLDEAKDAVYVQAVELAVAPERKSKPKRALIAVLAGLASGFLMVIWAFVSEALEKAKLNPDRFERMSRFKQYLRW